MALLPEGQPVRTRLPIHTLSLSASYKIGSAPFQFTATPGHLVSITHSSGGMFCPSHLPRSPMLSPTCNAYHIHKQSEPGRDGSHAMATSHASCIIKHHPASCIIRHGCQLLWPWPVVSISKSALHKHWHAASCSMQRKLFSTFAMGTRAFNVCYIHDPGSILPHAPWLSSLP